ncbi:hypothetical protein C451_04371, partial [Halococcus thailandensis JCM 13552]
SASVLAHRPWRKQIPEFLAEDMEPSIHEFRLTRETVAPADLDESLSDNECREIQLNELRYSAFALDR